MELVVDDYKTLSQVIDKLKKVSELKPYNQKSFNKLAMVYEGKEVKVLVSYTTPVVLIANGVVIKLQKDDWRTTSRTTMKHINAFLKRNGIIDKTISVKKWRVFNAD